ncbi:pyruvate formate lyase family protein [Neomoorella carbonis]|uniref:pyruvate formate lyase family protein n=1 Tax=Neomoorella carbonis TaxID=3062783 RepID=UPI00324B73F3
MSVRTTSLKARYKPGGVRTICLDRLRLYTESYKKTEGELAWLRRAKAMRHFCENRPLWIYHGENYGEGELIVGSIASQYRGASAYPEYAVKYYIDELDEQQKRKYRPFVIDEKEKGEWISLLKYWENKCVDDIKTERLKKEVPEIYVANKIGLGYLHHECESPAMCCVDYQKVLRIGLNGIIKEIEETQARFQKENDNEKVSKLEAMKISLEAVIIMAKRYAELAMADAERFRENNPKRAKELEKIAEICERVPAEPARSFWEALQSIFFVHLGLWIECNGPVISLGRLDQYLHPYYVRDVEEKRIISEDDALELLECFLLKINELERLQPMYVAENWPSHYQTVTIGGIDPQTGEYDYEKTGYLILKAMKNMRVQQPTVTIRWNPKLKTEFLFAALDVVKEGMGYPAFQGDPRNFRWLAETMPKYCSTPVVVPKEDVYNWAPVGCEETEIPGKTSPMLLGRINFLKLLQLALNNGVDTLTGIQAGPETKTAEDFKSMEDIWDAYKKQFDYWIDIMNRGTRIVHETHNLVAPLPFSSALVSDCIGRGKFVLEGGAIYDFPAPLREDGRYNHMGYGVANAADMLAVIQKWVFEEKRFTLKELMEACKNNWEGKEDLRKFIVEQTPHYGNDVEWVDNLAHKINEMYHSGNTIGGMWHSIGAHITDGRLTGASLDGRHDGDPVADAGVSPVQGMDKAGPTAVIKSAGRFDPEIRNWCQLLNMWLDPEWFSSKEKMMNILALLKVYFEKSMCNMVQFNVVDAAVLKAAKKEPEKYQDLMVRVSGFSHYFVDLTPSIQDEIISRTEHRYQKI